MGTLWENRVVVSVECGVVRVTGAAGSFLGAVLRSKAFALCCTVNLSSRAGEEASFTNWCCWVGVFTCCSISILPALSTWTFYMESNEGLKSSVCLIFNVGIYAHVYVLMYACAFQFNLCMLKECMYVRMYVRTLASSQNFANTSFLLHDPLYYDHIILDVE